MARQLRKLAGEATVLEALKALAQSTKPRVTQEFRRRQLNEREREVLALREQNQPFTDIARRLRISRIRARQIYQIARATRDYHNSGPSADLFYGLSTRAAKLLGATGFANRDKIMEAIRTGALQEQMARQKHFGPRTYLEICQWADLPVVATAMPETQRAVPTFEAG